MHWLDKLSLSAPTHHAYPLAPPSPPHKHILTLSYFMNTSATFSYDKGVPRFLKS
jgi:hypothetical protein